MAGPLCIYTGNRLVTIKDQLVQEFIANWRRPAGGGVPQEPLLRKVLAEYLSYRMAQQKLITYELYFIIEGAAKALRGWAFTSDQGVPATIEIKGSANSDGSLSIDFEQPPRNVKVDDLEEEVKAFSFSIKFMPDQGKRERSLSGDMYHPDFSNEKLVIAKTILGSRL